MKHQEHIVAVHARKFNELAKMNPQPNNIYDSSLFGDKIFKSEDVVISQRKALEEDNNYRQIIPYITIKNAEGKFLAYKRTKKGNESRLHQSLSIGFGGHMDAKDVIYDENSILDIDGSIKNAITREMKEELDGEDLIKEILDNIDNMNISKLIIDDTSEVEEVHIALLISVTIDGAENCKSKDSSIEMIGFVSKEEMENMDGEIENWSKIALK